MSTRFHSASNFAGNVNPRDGNNFSTYNFVTWHFHTYIFDANTEQRNGLEFNFDIQIFFEKIRHEQGNYSVKKNREAF